jgi:hypothetical protein
LTTDPEIELSALSRKFTDKGVTVQVDIYRLASSNDPWILEVIDADDNSLIWEDPFATEAEAWAEFQRAVDEDGIAVLIGPVEGEVH